MSDLISRSAIIKILGERAVAHYEDWKSFKDYIGDRKVIHRSELNECNLILDIIANMPPVEAPTWIPCSERLPEDGEDVLVWFEYFRYGNYNRLFQTTGISYTFDGEWSGFVNGSSGWSKLRIIAWMPLPKAYEGEIT